MKNGKLVIKGIATPEGEHKELNSQARKLANDRRMYEKRHEFIKVEAWNIPRGYLLVEKSKYQGNKKYYDSLKKKPE